MTGLCTILIQSSGVFALCLGLHVVWWRVRRPDAYREWLPILVAIFLAVGPALAWLFVRRRFFVVDAAPDPLTAWVAIVLLHGSVSAVYIIGYTLVSAFSPSIEIMKLLERNPDGLAREHVRLPHLESALGVDRVRNLLGGGLILADGDSVRLGSEARLIAGLVLFYRHLIGLPDGAGG